MDKEIAKETCAIDALHAFLKANADLIRLQILKLLENESFNVQELCQILAIKQSALSHHLKLMASSELVSTRREGNTIYYRRQIPQSQSPFFSLQTALWKLLANCEMSEEHSQQIEQVNQLRVAKSQQFFVDNAKKFRSQQDLIASFAQYEVAVADFIKSISLPSHQHVIEIGPGEGLFLPRLAQEFKQVSAFDIAAELLVEAEQVVAQAGLSNVSLTLGDTAVARSQVQAADCAVLNMVLHHVASPVDIFHDVAASLKPQGAMVVTDLCHHDQEWAKTACGDVWLGFEPDELSQWAFDAGFKQGQSSYLAQRNGFRIQIRHFIK